MNREDLYYKDLLKYFQDTKQMKTYDLQGELVAEFAKQHPDHTDYSCVELKVKLLNLFYSTGIKAVDAMVRNILSIKDIDKILAEPKACPELVHRIARLQLSGGVVRDNYSFATKYCALHQPAKYPIYDSIVAAIMMQLFADGKLPPYRLKTDRSAKSGKSCMTKSEFFAKLKDYKSYIEIYDCFMKNFGLSGHKDVSYRMVDTYLWGSVKSPFFTSEIEKIVKLDKKLYNEYGNKTMPKQTPLKR